MSIPLLNLSCKLYIYICSTELFRFIICTCHQGISQHTYTYYLLVMKMFSALLSILGANLLYFILHINNTSSFPKPLNPKEEASALERLKNGDKDARALLIERNLRLVSHIVKKYYSKTNDTDDLISIGTIGLIKAIDSFNPDKCIRLATYASRCIEKATLSVRLFQE